VFRCGRPHFLAQNTGLFEKYGGAGRGGGEPGGKKGGGGSIFRDFVRTSFMDGPNKAFGE